MSETAAKKRRNTHPFTEKSTKNPLAAARKGNAFKKQKQEEATTKKTNHDRRTTVSTKAEQMWHKRSGAGLRLFVEYYCGQPMGVIVSRDSAESTSNDNETTTIQRVQAVKGMSRAAQRRRKKKKQKNGGNAGEEKMHYDGRHAESMVSGHDSSSINFIPRRLYNDQLLTILETKIQQSNDASSNQVNTNLHAYRSFFEALSTPLPLTFRVRRSLEKDVATSLRQQLDTSTFSSHIQPTVFDADIYYAHQGLDKSSLPRVCAELKEFLNRHSSDGSIARQELGSMLPVWLLERTGVFEKFHKSIQGLRVLDMCASPGSKTLQAVELNVLASSGGTVRANDISESRLEALKDAIQRSGVPSIEKMVKYANFDASKYPIPKTEAKKYPVVLCDVPCSGDGTCRKDPHIIPTWLPSIGNNLHSLQTRILSRALQLVAKNGVVSYSTCSLNPVEDEAVVAAALSQIKHSKSTMEFEIMKIPSERMRGLILRNGVGEWKVGDFSSSNESSKADHQEGFADSEEDALPNLTWYESYQDALAGGMDCACESLWPTEASQFQLSRCLRLFPQDQNSGGFFVALIRRVE